MYMSIYFFFVKKKTAYEVRIGDWSSDVCSSDLPDGIVVEGQGALSHPAYITSAHILRGSQPAGVIVQHAPKREVLGDFPMVAMPTVASEVALIEAFADTKVNGITLNHEIGRAHV